MRPRPAAMAQDVLVARARFRKGVGQLRHPLEGTMPPPGFTHPRGFAIILRVANSLGFGILVMAAVALMPRVRMMAICDGVRESKIEPGVFHLKGVRQGITAEAFPFTPSRLWLFLLLSSPRPGVFPGYVRVLNDKTEKIIFYAHLEPPPTFEEDEPYWATRVPIRCSFPEEGRYTVEVWFFQKQGTDVLKGEHPFFVEKW